MYISNQKGVPRRNKLFLDNRSSDKLIVTKLSLIFLYELKKKMDLASFLRENLYPQLLDGRKDRIWFYLKKLSHFYESKVAPVGAILYAKSYFVVKFFHNNIKILLRLVLLELIVEVQFHEFFIFESIRLPINGLMSRKTLTLNFSFLINPRPIR